MDKSDAKPKKSDAKLKKSDSKLKKSDAVTKLENFYQRKKEGYVVGRRPADFDVTTRGNIFMSEDPLSFGKVKVPSPKTSDKSEKLNPKQEGNEYEWWKFLAGIEDAPRAPDLSPEPAPEVVEGSLPKVRLPLEKKKGKAKQKRQLASPMTQGIVHVKDKNPAETPLYKSDSEEATQKQVRDQAQERLSLVTSHPTLGMPRRAKASDRDVPTWQFTEETGSLKKRKKTKKRKKIKKRKKTKKRKTIPKKKKKTKNKNK